MFDCKVYQVRLHLPEIGGDPAGGWRIAVTVLGEVQAGDCARCYTLNERPQRREVGAGIGAGPSIEAKVAAPLGGL